MKKRLPQYLLVLLIPVVLLLAFRPTDKFFEIQKNLDIFATLYREVNAYYVDEVNPTTLMKTGIDAMLQSLDPYTNYIPEDEIEEYRTQHTGQYGGIGALVTTRDGRSVITMPYEGFPAHKAGLKIGDEILKINGISLAGKTAAQVSKLLKGQAGTEVKLEILSYGQPAPKEVKLNRENIKIDNVRYYGMVAPEVGYVQLTDFTQGASREVKNAIDKLKAEGAKKIVLDLRGNPGGLLNEAVNIANLFVPTSSEIVRTKGKIAEWNKVYRALNEPLDAEIPVIVLTNGRSASASEIVAGVIQDYDRGLLIGQKTFGKGLVQATRVLSYNAQLKVTTAKYYTPSGRCIQALDYSRRKEDGSAVKYADSLKTAYKTKNGRTVYDGAGIDPDITIEPRRYAAITQALRNKNLLFEYANEYALRNPSISASAKDFKLTEAEYGAFVQWLKTKDIEYSNTVEKALKELEERAKDEKMYPALETQIKALAARASHNRESDLQIHKAEIKGLLESEIVARYYFEKGQTLNSFNNDPELQAAIEVFKDFSRYQRILQGKR